MGPRILYGDRRILLVIKPQGVLSVEGPGGMPELLRQALHEPQGCVKAVHRLDQVTGGLMVYARSQRAAAILSEAIREQRFHKRYLAVIRGRMPQDRGTLQDLLYRSNRDKKTYVVPEMGKGVQPAQLSYRVLETAGELSLLEIELKTGRTHQIRAQLSSRGLPLLGDRKYGSDEAGPVALWSCYLSFPHPQTRETVTCSAPPPADFPWNTFETIRNLPPQEEVLDLVDEQAEPTGATAARSAVHSLGLWHRTAHVWMLRRRGGRVQVLLQKRAAEKDSFLGCYDISSAGHIPAGMAPLDSALRELREELGLREAAAALIPCGSRWVHVKEQFHGAPFLDEECARVYALWRDVEPGDLNLQPSEVSGVKWMDLEKCKQAARSRDPAFCIYPEELEMLNRAL